MPEQRGASDRFAHDEALGERHAHLAPNCASRLSISCRNVGAVSRVDTASPDVGAN